MGRRGNHEGTAERLPNGKWRARAWVDGVRVSSTTEATKTLALASLRRVIEELSKPKAPREVPTLGDFVYEQLAGPLNKGPEELARTTWATHSLIYRTRIEGHPIADKKLNEIDRKDVEEWRDGIALAPRSVNRYLQFLKTMFARAQDQGYIQANPCKAVKAYAAPEPLVLTLSTAQVSRLLKLPMSDRLQRAILLGLHGLRRAEACGLMYEDFDGEGVTIRRQAQEVEGRLQVRKSLKTKTSAAWVPVDEALAAQLRGGEGFVLATESGKPMSPRNLDRDFQKVIRGTEFERIETEAGTFRLTLHDLRATFGMRLLESGVDIRTAAELMRHSPEMLIKMYARSRRDLKKDAIRRLSIINHPTNHPINPRLEVISG